MLQLTQLDLEGTWIPTRAELAGATVPPPVLSGMRLTVEGRRYTVQAGGNRDAGVLRLDPAAYPWAMDIIGTDGPNRGKTIPAIFQNDGAELKVCYDLEGIARPEQFKTEPNTRLFLVTYRRQEA